MTDMETETIDKLYLELSQFSRARTRREIELNAGLMAVKAILNNRSAMASERILNALTAIDNALSRASAAE